MSEKPNNQIQNTFKSVDFGARIDPLTPFWTENKIFLKPVAFIHSSMSVIRHNVRKNLINRFRKMFRSDGFRHENELFLQSW